VSYRFASDREVSSSDGVSTSSTSSKNPGRSRSSKYHTSNGPTTTMRHASHWPTRNNRDASPGSTATSVATTGIQPPTISPARNGDPVIRRPRFTSRLSQTAFSWYGSFSAVISTHLVRPRRGG
jgi:hypothetical protein